jgi:hypothetical protein
MSVCIVGCLLLFALPDDKLPEKARQIKASMMKGKDKTPPA